MLRFLAMRIASALPVMVILSLVTFAIIQAPPGDYADYIRSQLINQGGASFEEADAQAFLFYCFIFGQSLLFLDRGPRKRAQLLAQSADKLLAEGQ